MTQPVRLGPTYLPDLWDLHKRVYEARRAGAALVTIALSAPITSDPLEVAIESGSLYLVGIRTRSGWHEFYPDDTNADPRRQTPATPRLPGSRWIMVGARVALSTYRALGLSWMLTGAPGTTGQVAYAERPADLLRFFSVWNGNLASFEAKLAVCVLIFIVCEALRFRSIESICADWIYVRGFRNHVAAAGSTPIGPIASEMGRIDPVMFPAFVITSGMLEIVQNWHARAMTQDVWTRPPDFPDPLIG